MTTTQHIQQEMQTMPDWAIQRVWEYIQLLKHSIQPPKSNTRAMSRRMLCLLPLRARQTVLAQQFQEAQALYQQDEFLVDDIDDAEDIAL